MTAVEGLLSSITGLRVSDVCVPGFLDSRDGWPRFVPWQRTWYLRLESGFLRIDAVHGEGRLGMRLVPAIEQPEPLAEEDEELVVASYGDLFFDTSGPSLPITGARYVTDSGSDVGRGLIRLVEFELGGAQTVVFDPMWFFGIRPGPTGVYERLVEQEREYEPALEEHVWRP